MTCVWEICDFFHRFLSSMDRSIAVGNRICAKRQEDLRRFRHEDRLSTTKPTIDRSVPSTLTLSHLKVNMKREQMQEDRFMEVDRSNRVMMQRIADLARKPGIGLEMVPGSRGMPSLNKVARRKSLKRITEENQGILRRIRDIQPQYDHVRWEQDYRRTRMYLRNACEFPSKSAFVAPQSPPEPFPIPSLFTHLQKVPEECVSGRLAKLGKRFEDTFYLLEVFKVNDSTLLVTAFSGKDKDLELRVENFAGTDYTKLLDCVRISQGRLMVLS